MSYIGVRRALTRQLIKHHFMIVNEIEINAGSQCLEFREQIIGSLQRCDLNGKTTALSIRYSNGRESLLLSEAVDIFA